MLTGDECTYTLTKLGLQMLRLNNNPELAYLLGLSNANIAQRAKQGGAKNRAIKNTPKMIEKKEKNFYGGKLINSFQLC